MDITPTDSPLHVASVCNVSMDILLILSEQAGELLKAYYMLSYTCSLCTVSGIGVDVVACTQGLPLSLNGVKRIMTSMDWGDAEGFVSIGAVGAEEVSRSASRMKRTVQCCSFGHVHSRSSRKGCIEECRSADTRLPMYEHHTCRWMTATTTSWWCALKSHTADSAKTSAEQRCCED
jgi:hypothetical protein